MQLKDKVAIVTGGGSGINRAIALDLGKEGCKVVISSNVKSELDEVFSELIDMETQALSICLDLSKEGNCKKLVKDTLDKFGTVDILINGAGVLYQKPYLEHRLKEWDKTFEINLRSYFILSQLVLDVMRKKHDGYIINMSSTAVNIHCNGDLAAYGISKYGVQGLSAVTYEASIRDDFGVRVSTIYPAGVDTAMARSIKSEVEFTDWMQPEDIANVVLFLLKTEKRVMIKNVFVENNPL